MVALVAVLCVATLVLLVAWGLRVMRDIDELENLPRLRVRMRGGVDSDSDPQEPHSVRLVPDNVRPFRAS